jgi:hypothetical protein
MSSIINKIKETYSREFRLHLDDQWILSSIARELVRRRDSFIDAQLAHEDLSNQQLIEIYTSVKGASPFEDTALPRKRGRKPLPEQERVARRKAYARAYYVKKKKDDTV